MIPQVLRKRGKKKPPKKSPPRALYVLAIYSGVGFISLVHSVYFFNARFLPPLQKNDS
jgi:hypothetical protein